MVHMRLQFDEFHRWVRVELREKFSWQPNLSSISIRLAALCNSLNSREKNWTVESVALWCLIWSYPRDCFKWVTFDKSTASYGAFGGISKLFSFLLPQPGTDFFNKPNNSLLKYLINVSKTIFSQLARLRISRVWQMFGPRHEILSDYLLRIGKSQV